MSNMKREGTWHETYVSEKIAASNDWRLLITTFSAINDRLELAHNVSIVTRSDHGNAESSIKLSPNQMRDVAAMLLRSADRLDELTAIRAELIAEITAESEVAA